MLTMTREDFMIKASSFDLTQEWNIIRIAAGALMFPHALGKFQAWDATVGFFAKAGFAPPEVWVYVAAAVETIAGLLLVLGVGTRFAASVAACVLFVAAFALVQVRGWGWVWSKGGVEYPVFWGLICVAIALQQIKPRLAA